MAAALQHLEMATPGAETRLAIFRALQQWPCGPEQPTEIGTAIAAAQRRQPSARRPPETTPEPPSPPRPPPPASSPTRPQQPAERVTPPPGAATGAEDVGRRTRKAAAKAPPGDGTADAAHEASGEAFGAMRCEFDLRRQREDYLDVHALGSLFADSSEEWRAAIDATADGLRRAALRPREIVVYALGRLARADPRRQLAFACALAEALHIPNEGRLYFDPDHTARDHATLQALGWSSIGRDEEGQRAVASPTLFFMPCAPFALIEAVVRSNAHQLPQIALLGADLEWVWDRRKAYGQALPSKPLPPGIVKEPCRAPAVQQAARAAAQHEVMGEASLVGQRLTLSTFLGTGDPLSHRDRTGYAVADGPPPTRPESHITSIDDLKQILNGVPDGVEIWLVSCEYSGRVRSALSRQGHFAISCDYRETEVEGPHFVGDVRKIAHLRRWHGVVAFPPCTHQTRHTGVQYHAAKATDGRMWWGMAFVAWHLSIDADVILVEQPATYIPTFYQSPTQTVQPFFFGDDRQKETHFYIVGGAPIQRTSTMTSGDRTWQALTARLPPDERERERSRIGYGMAAAIASQLRATDPAPRPPFSARVKAAARRWFAEGLPLPDGHDAHDAQPAGAASRAYQFTKGHGDGRVAARSIDAPESLYEGDLTATRRQAHPSSSNVGRARSRHLTALL